MPRLPAPFLPAILATAVSLVACAQEDGSYDPSSDKNDDLVDRLVDVEIRDTIAVENGPITVRPLLVENDDSSISITTDAIFHEYLGSDIDIVADFGDASQRNGLIVEYRLPSDTEWTRITPFPGKSSYTFNKIFVWEKVGGKTKIFGNAWSFEDSLLGLTQPSQNQVEFNTVVDATSFELRVLPIPTWNWGDWDDGEYEIAVEVNAPR